MNIHISGLDSGNKDNYKSQTEILNKLFPYEDLKKKQLIIILNIVRTQNGMLLFIQIKTPIILI